MGWIEASLHPGELRPIVRGAFPMMRLRMGFGLMRSTDDLASKVVIMNQASH